MANVINTQILVDGPRNTVLKVVGILDTSDLAATVVADPATLAGIDFSGTVKAARLRIKRVTYSIEDGLSVRLDWTATVPVPAAVYVGRSVECYDHFGGLQNNAADAGNFGVISLSTQGWTASAVLSFTMEIELVKQQRTGSTASPIAFVPFSTASDYSSGQQVLYAGSLYTFTAAHPAGNWTGNDVTYNGQNEDWPLNTVGYSKPVGIVNAWTRGTLATGNTTTPTQSRGFKLDLEAPFSALRVELFQLEPTAMRGFAISLAPTETDSLATLSQAINPIVNGTSHSVIKGADPYGFTRLTFDGALRSPVQGPGGTTAPGRGYFTNMSSVLSDWAAVSSVPVVQGKRPMIVGRSSRIVNIGDANSNIVPSSLTGLYNRYVANDPSGRLMYHPLVGTNGDHVADPTLSQATGALYDATSTAAWQNIAFIAQHDVPTRVVAQAGDSITEGYFPIGSIVARLSTQKAPAYSVNLGCSTNTSAQYFALLEGFLRGTNWITDTVIPSFSPNESQNMTTAFRDAKIAQLAYYIEMHRVLKKRLYIWTSYAQYITRYSVNSSDVAIIQAINDYVRTEAAKSGSPFELVEVANGWDNATMTRTDDAIHPTAAGNAWFDSQFTPVYQKGR